MSEDKTDTVDAVDFYWRPGCPFCARLERNLDQAEIPIAKINIWEDPEAAAFVRSVADGNETVPTVTIGDRSLVNPSVGQVTEILADVAPHLVP